MKKSTRLICHPSLLRSDYARLKGLNRTARQCSLGNLAAIDDVNHLLLQYPALHVEGDLIFDKLRNIWMYYLYLGSKEGMS